MNLPLILDIVLGLLFIYLILSLLASEIQELLTTLMQWRAEHLKKSIEILIIGDNREDNSDIEFVDKLYSSPLLKALNQEAKGPISQFFRLLAHRMGETLRLITRSRNVFGQQTSGPSYIPAKTFVKALLEDLDIQNLIRQKSYEVLEQAIEEKLELMRRFLDTLRQEIDDETFLIAEFEDLRHRLATVHYEFGHQQLAFSATMEQLIEQMKTFLSTTNLVLQDDERCKAILHRRLPYIMETIATRRLEPTIASVVKSVLDDNNSIPAQLKRNLMSLAQNTQVQAIELAEELRGFEDSLAQWFDQSMTRAAGVYKRNSKGIAFILGFVIAVATNTDTIYIVNRLSTDSVLRETIVQTANQSVVEEGRFNPANQAIASSEDENSETNAKEAAARELQDAKNAVQLALEELPLPIGWKTEIVAQQRQQASDWSFPILRRIIGWLVTGIALSMGAPFWYNLISKVIKVRNTGGTGGDKNAEETMVQ